MGLGGLVGFGGFVGEACAVGLGVSVGVGVGVAVRAGVEVGVCVAVWVAVAVGSSSTKTGIMIIKPGRNLSRLSKQFATSSCCKVIPFAAAN